MVFEAPCYIKGDIVVRAGMEQEINIPGFQRFEIPGNEDVIVQPKGKCLDIFPAMTCCQCIVVIDGTKRAS